jgi:predicted YcjX-like family ATPase
MPLTTNIALTGSACSGKTNFLTSLIWHLDRLNQKKFDVKGAKKGNDRVPIKLSKIELAPDRKSTFNFPLMRTKLTTNFEFAEKTLDTQDYSIEFDRDDWRIYRQRLQFFDFPGERFADTAIACYDKYDNWATSQINDLQNEPTIAKEIKDYLDAVSTATDKQQCIYEYRQLLIRLWHKYCTLISPSVFSLDQNGKHLSSASTDPQKQPVGLLGYEFCPLPKDILDGHADILTTFRQNYKRYQKQVVFPAFKRLFSAQKLLIFVDIPSILMAGSNRLNNEQKIIENTLKALDHNTFIGKRIYKFLSIKRNIYDIAFVATKADMVHRDDFNNGKFKNLLKDMSSFVGTHFSFNCKHFACSAICSSLPDTFPNMIGKLKNPPDGFKPEDKVKYAVSPLPDEWPPAFQAGTYTFPDLLPNVSESQMYPPEHIDLDIIFNHLIN